MLRHLLSKLVPTALRRASDAPPPDPADPGLWTRVRAHGNASAGNRRMFPRILAETRLPPSTEDCPVLYCAADR